MFKLRFCSNTVVKLLLLGCIVLLLNGCATVSTPRPKNVLNSCQIFDEYPRWYKASVRTKQRWGVPIAVQLAMVNRESSFNGKAKPGRTRILGFIPGPRLSTAYGYAQAKDETWADYRRRTGRVWASRTDFDDAIDFLGWYVNTIHNKLGISYYDPYRLYIAYHEGIGGYTRRTYAAKPWLLKVAAQVQYRAKVYQMQLQQCRRVT